MIPALGSSLIMGQVVIERVAFFFTQSDSFIDTPRQDERTLYVIMQEVDHAR
jgi:hypothetical protein